MEGTSPKFFCFILMPFTADFDDIYNYGIKETCKNLGAYCERVDEQIFQESILDRIFNQISKADLIIADMTGRNPNVFYEVGYAHALNKPTILLTKDTSDIPFDLKHFPHIIYEGKISQLREALTKRLSWFIQNINVQNNFKNEIEIYVGNKNIASNSEIVSFPNGDIPRIKLTVHNSSSKTYESGQFQVAVLTKDFKASGNESVKITQLPNGYFQHMLPFFDHLFPDSYTTKTVFLSESKETRSVNEFSVTVKIFMESGASSYNIFLKRE